MEIKWRQLFWGCVYYCPQDNNDFFFLTYVMAAPSNTLSMFLIRWRRQYAQHPALPIGEIQLLYSEMSRWFSVQSCSNKYMTINKYNMTICPLLGVHDCLNASNRDWLSFCCGERLEEKQNRKGFDRKWVKESGAARANYCPVLLGKSEQSVENSLKVALSVMQCVTSIRVEGEDNSWPIMGCNN